ncbi:MAG: hypothetical protein JWP80_371 [Pseudomonas sp.]|nr:hypothetical protein [Pseudomonas sp.]
MLIVSFQGTQLTARQRQQLELRKQVKSTFMNPILTESVNQALKAVEERKEQGVKPERIWFLDHQVKGTPSFAEWMGY